MYHKNDTIVCLLLTENNHWYSLVMLPHLYPCQLLPSSCKHIESMQNFVGLLEYLQSWVWGSDATVVQSSYTGATFSFCIDALPLLIDTDGDEGVAVFPADEDAFRYAALMATRDLQYRGLREERTNCFAFKQKANFL